MRAKFVYRRDDFMVSRPAAAAHAVSVMQLRWAIQRNTDQPVVLAQERTPGVVKHDPVGLKSINDPFSAGVPCLQRHHATKKIQPAERGFSALPGKLHLRPRLRINVLLNKRVQRDVIHHRLLRFSDIKTVTTIQIAA